MIKVMTPRVNTDQQAKLPDRNRMQQAVAEQGLPNGFIDTVMNHYAGIAETIAQRRRQQPGPLIVSINGAQGSGKSTLTEFLELMLDDMFQLRAANLSIDDFYLTRAARQQLAATVHPLFITRGVPGTHDLDLAKRTLDCLRQDSASGTCSLPRFDKAKDDRRPESEWPRLQLPIDVILFEGWCNHAPVQNEAELAEPVNELEQNEDRDGRWRGYVNQQLQHYHEVLFSQAHLLLYLQAPSFEKVFEWRELQESKLRQAVGSGQGLMTAAQLRRFIQHYERLTRSCLERLPQQADILVRLGDDHAIKAVTGTPKVAHV